MVWIVVSANILLAAGLLWLAWQMIQLRKAFRIAAEAVDGYTLACQRGLSVSPPAIFSVQHGTALTRDLYATLQVQLQRYRFLFRILRLLQSAATPPHGRRSRQGGKVFSTRSRHVQRRR